MKSKKIFAFLMLPLLLTSCLTNIKETRLTYNLDFNLDSEKATILLKGGYLSSSLNIKIDENIIPGDQLIIKHTGDVTIQESYPSKIDIYNGNVVPRQRQGRFPPHFSILFCRRPAGHPAAGR